MVGERGCRGLEAKGAEGRGGIADVGEVVVGAGSLCF